MFDNNGRRIYTDFRELAEAKRQEAYEQMRRGAAAARDADSSYAESTPSPVSSLIDNRDDGPETEARYRGWPLRGVFVNKTLTESFTVFGDFKGESGRKHFIVGPGESTPDNCDADFFKTDSSWYKIMAGVVTISKTVNGYRIRGLVKNALPKDVTHLEKELREHSTKQYQKENQR